MDFSKEILHFITEQTGGIVIVDAISGSIVYADVYYTEKYGDEILGQSAADVLFYLNDCPQLTSGEAPTEWEGIDFETKQYYKFNSACFEKDGNLYHIHQITDITEYMGLNRDITKYMSFFKKLSKFQTAVLEKLSNTYYEMLPLVVEHFKTGKAYFFLEREEYVEMVTYCAKDDSYTNDRMTLCEAVGNVFAAKSSEEIVQSDFGDVIGEILCSNGDAQDATYRFLCGGDVSGQRYAIYLESVPHMDLESIREKTLLSVIRLYAENGIMREKLIYDSEHDRLTGLYNKGKYLSMVETVYPYKEKVAVFNYDVNNLKKMNDTYGHEAGDKLLIKAADSIRKVTDLNIHGYRMGGDEFLMVAVDIEEDALEPIKARWEAELAKLNTLDDGIHCVVALGIAYGAGSQWEALCKRADELMYEDKKRKKKPGEEIR